MRGCRSWKSSAMVLNVARFTPLWELTSGSAESHPGVPPIRDGPRAMKLLWRPVSLLPDDPTGTERLGAQAPGAPSPYATGSARRCSSSTPASARLAAGDQLQVIIGRPGGHGSVVHPDVVPPRQRESVGLTGGRNATTAVCRGGDVRVQQAVLFEQ